MLFIEFSNQSKKFLKTLDKHTTDRIIKRLENLREEPIPRDSKFIGRENGEKVFRYRVGNYRALYKLKEKDKVILIIKIDKRSKVYN